ncbi:RING finger protein vilya [Drosophila bipectinata]|uniref:RING finger protein vilya n=1 Tax=Drosophila bipectinata TaxID=42026 RepID=UPI0007E88ADF|nr:RING finger protein vilya [Drosophila bipectinata]
MSNVSKLSKAPAMESDDCVMVNEPSYDALKLWIHCNRCFEIYFKNKTKLILLACHHVSCEKCVKVCVGRTPSDALIYQCPICRKEVRGRLVGNNMPSGIKMLFHPEPWSLHNDFIETFQESNNRHFARFKERQEKIVAKLAKDIEMTKSICQKRYIEMKHMAVERRKALLRQRQIKVALANRKNEQTIMLMKRKQELKKKQLLAAAYAAKSGTQRSNSSQRNQRSRSSSPAAGTSKGTPKRKVTGFMHLSNHSFDL